MKIIRVIIQIFILYTFSFLGEVLHDFFNLAVPGNILGLLLLFVSLSLKVLPLRWIRDGAGFLLAFLPLVFIPSNIGVMNYPSLFSGKGALVIFTVAMSTIISVITAGLASQVLEKKIREGEEMKGCNKHSSPSS